MPRIIRNNIVFHEIKLQQILAARECNAHIVYFAFKHADGTITDCAAITPFLPQIGSIIVQNDAQFEVTVVYFELEQSPIEDATIPLLLARCQAIEIVDDCASEP